MRHRLFALLLIAAAGVFAAQAASPSVEAQGPGSPGGSQRTFGGRLHVLPINGTSGAARH